MEKNLSVGVNSHFGTVDSALHCAKARFNAGCDGEDCVVTNIINNDFGLFKVKIYYLTPKGNFSMILMSENKKTIRNIPVRRSSPFPN